MGKGMKLSFTVKNFFVRVINMKASLACVILVVTLHLSVLSVSGQEVVTRPSKAEAMAAWESGNYEVAYNQFNGLLLLYSRDPVYRYYTGACLVRLERDIPRAVTLLGSAINGSVNIRSVPADVWFYYGRALQMNGSFPQASDAFMTFIKNAGKKVAIEYDVAIYLDECNRKQGALENEQGVKSVERKEESVESKEENGEILAQGTEPRPQGTEAMTQDTAVPKSEVSTVPEEYEIKLAEAVKLQYSADSLTRLAQGVRKEMQTSAPEKQEVLQSIALELEGAAAAKQADADNAFLALEQPDEVRPEENPISPKPSQEAAYYQFAVLAEPAYSDTKPIPVDIMLPEGLVYTIQLAAFKNPVPPALFKGLYPLYAKRKPENDVTFYFTGLFRTHEAARQALAKVRAEGLTDAFIIALMDETKISLERAALLEKEWAVKPFPGIEPEVSVPKEIPVADTLPVGTLTFRAEALRSKKPLKPDAIERIELLAGTRGLDMIKNSQGETVFLIGNFITFESAEEYVSLLIRNGYTTARVAAYVGMQEIPVEAARELLNKLE
jgi:hypothetical protein